MYFLLDVGYLKLPLIMCLESGKPLSEPLTLNSGASKCTSRDLVMEERMDALFSGPHSFPWFPDLFSSLFTSLPPPWSVLYECCSIPSCFKACAQLFSFNQLFPSLNMVISLISASLRPPYFLLVLPPCTHLYLSSQKYEPFAMTFMQTWHPCTTLRSLHITCFSLSTTLWD